MADADQINVLNVAGKTYAINLYWGEPDDQGKIVDEAFAEAARQDMDIYCVRDESRQFGLGLRADGHAKGMPSLAGQLADNYLGSWLGLFETDSGYYLLAVRDDKILAETDKVFADEVDASATFEELLSRVEWKSVYAPASLGMHDTQDVALTAMLPGKVKAPRLQEVNRVSSFLRKMLLLGGVAVVVIGGLVYFKLSSDAENAARMAALEQAARNSLGQKKPQVVVPPSPWENHPLAASYLSACSEAMRKAVIDIPGWHAKSVSCNGGAYAVLTVERNAALGYGGGTVNWIRWALSRHGLEKASASPTGENGVEISWPIGDVEVNKSGLTPPKLLESQRYLQSWLEEAFTPVHFVKGKRTQFYDNVGFHFVTPYDPTRFASILSKIDGLTIDRVSLDLVKYQYSIEGTLNEKFPVPSDGASQTAPKPATQMNGQANAR